MLEGVNTVRYLITPMETEEEMDGKGYVHWKSWQESYTGLIDRTYLEERITLEKCIQIAHRRPERILIAKDGEKVIGFVGYGAYRDDTLSDHGEIYALYVLQSYQIQGVGHALISAAMKLLRNYDQIALWVLEDNERAIRFYKRCGFHFDGVTQEIMLGSPIKECRMFYPLETSNCV